MEGWKHIRYVHTSIPPYFHTYAGRVAALLLRAISRPHTLFKNVTMAKVPERCPERSWTRPCSNRGF